MKYAVTYRGMTLREFKSQGELDAFLADKVFEWTGQGEDYTAHLGTDYIELVTAKGNKITLDVSLVPDNPFAERGLFK